MKKYRLEQDVILRKEWFGCLIYQPTIFKRYQFNEDTFTVLKRLTNRALTLNELHADLALGGFDFPQDDLNEFLGEMVEKRILSIADNGESRCHDYAFFFNKSPLRKDCLAAPSNVSIYITDYCPKRCRHCVSRSSPKRERMNELGPAEWFKVIHKLRAGGVCSLVFTGGEPLSLPWIFDVLKEAERKNFIFTLLTDYDAINEHHLRELKSLRLLRCVQVSLDGGNKESHEFIRGKNSFESALRRLALLQASSVPYTIAVAVHKKNLNTLDQVVEIYQQYGASSLYLNPLTPYGRGQSLNSLLLDDHELRWLGQKYLSLIATGKIKVINTFWEGNLNRIDDAEFHPFQGALSAVSLGTHNLAIGSRGECYPDSKLKSLNQYYLGNITTQSLEKIWRNPKLNHLRSFYSPEHFAFTDQSNI